MTSGITGIVSVVDSEGFSVQAHKVGHRDVINRTDMVHLFIGDLVVTPGSWKMFSASGKFSYENNFTILVKVKLLRAKVYYDSRGGFRL